MTQNGQNIRHTTAPISMDLLREYFTNKEIKFHIDYANSQLKGRQFLTYVSNLNVPVDITYDETLPVEDRFALVQEYMNQQNLANIDVLVKTVAEILVRSKGSAGLTNIYEEHFLTAEQIDQFIQENKLLVGKWRVLMDSMVIYAMAINVAYVETFGHPRDTYECIDDATVVGKNFVWLFEDVDFVEQFYMIPGVEFYYFVKQFDDYMFAGKNLFAYFITEANHLGGIVQFMGSHTVDFEKIVQQLKEYEEEELRAAAG